MACGISSLLFPCRVLVGLSVCSFQAMDQDSWATDYGPRDFDRAEFRSSSYDGDQEMCLRNRSYLHPAYQILSWFGLRIRRMDWGAY